MTNFLSYLKKGWKGWRLIFRLSFIALILLQSFTTAKLFDLHTQYTWRGLLGTTGFVFALVEIFAFIYYRRNREILPALFWGLPFLSVILDFGSDFFFLYAKFWWWDRLLHFASSLNVCLILFAAIRLLYANLAKRITMFLAFTSALSLAVFYEILEYVEDLIYMTNRSGPGKDTADDLLFNTLGVITALLIFTKPFDRLQNINRRQ